MVDGGVEAFVEWASETAIPVPTLDSAQTKPNWLAALDPLLDGKRIVYLGEPDHNIAERVDYRVLMLQHLVSRGFRFVASERGFSDGLRTDRYLETGDERWIDRASDFGYRGCLVDGRDDDYDPHRGRWPDEWVKLRRSEDRWFYRQLRMLGDSLPGSDDRIHFYGFDADFVPGAGYEDLAELLAASPSRSLADLRRALARVEGESLEDEIGRLTRAIDLAESTRSQLGGGGVALGEAEVGLLIESAVALRDSLFFRAELEAAFGAERPDPVRWYRAMGTREAAMGRRMDWLLDRCAPETKVAICGHNTHLAKDQRALWLDRVGQPQIPPMSTLGHYLNETRPGQVLSIWLLFDHGRHLPHPMDRNKQLDVPGDPKRIESLLAGIGPAYVLPLNTGDPRAALLDDEWDYWTGASTQSCIPRRQADAIFFIREVHDPRGRD